MASAYKNFIPELWSARLLAHLDNVHVYADLMNRDYEGEITQQGDTVHINQSGDVTILDYNGSDLGNPEELASTLQDLKIDQAKAFNFQVKDIDRAQSNVSVLDAAMQRASYGMNDKVDTYLAGILSAAGTAGNKNVITGVTAEVSNAYDNLVDLGTILSENNVPMLGRWVVIPPWYHGLLLKDPRFVGNGTGFNQAILENGLVGHAAGFEIRVSNNVPNTSGSKYRIIGGTTAAGSYAEQLLELEAYRPEKNFSDAIKGLHVYGAKVVLPKGLAVLEASKKAAS